MQKEVRDDIVAVILACVCSAAGFLPVYLSTDNPGTSSFSRFASCVPTTVLLSVYLLGLPRLLSDRSKQVVGGSPRYSYLISFAHQALIFPFWLCAELSVVVGSGSSVSDWLHSSWPKGFTGRLAAHAALFAYWFADVLATPNPPVIVVHHLVCLGVVSASIAELVGPSSAVFLCGAVTFEAGNVCLSLSKLYQGNRALNWLSITFMTASNVLASLIALWFSSAFRGGGAVPRTVVMMVALGFAAARENEEVQRWRGGSGQGTGASSVGKKA